MTIFTDNTAADAVAFSDVATYTFNAGGFPIDAIAMSDVATFRWRAGANLNEIVAFAELATAGTHSKLSATEFVAFTDAVFRALVGITSDVVTFADVATVARALLVADALGFAELIKLNGIYGLSLIDTIVANEVLQKFWGKSVKDTMPFLDTVLPQWVFGGVPTDALAFGDTVTPTLMMHMQTTDDFEIDDSILLSAIYHASLSEGVCFSVALLDPGGGFTTWAVNTRTAAITEYENFSYNSFAQLGNHYLGASSAGLFQLDGTLDNTTSIIARIKSGSAQFAGSRYTSFDAIYLGCRVSDSGRDWILKLHAGDGRVYVYQFHPLNRRTTKIFPGKGLRSRYFSWELITAGEDFDLDEIEFVPIGSKRRV
jgi:hypothetical protein